MTIFIVDDEETLRQVLASELISVGFACHTFELKNIAYNRVLDLQPDLIISDIKAPVMDGFQFLRYLRANPFTRNIPFIFVTGFADLKNAIESKRLGAADFVSKPYDLMDLLTTIKRVLNTEWNEHIYPENMSPQDDLTFADWATLETLFIEHLDRAEERTDIIATSDAWRVHFIVDHPGSIIGGIFFRPLDLDKVSEYDILQFHSFLDEQGLDLGVMIGFFNLSPEIENFATLLGIQLADARRTVELLSTPRTTNYSLLTELGFNAGAAAASREFLKLTSQLLSEIEPFVGKQFRIAMPRPETTGEYRSIKFTLKEGWNGGYRFESPEDKLWVHVPVELIWKAMGKLFQQRHITRVDICEDMSTASCLFKLLSKLPSLIAEDERLTLE